LFAKAGRVEGVVEANDEVVLLDDLPDRHGNFLNDARLAGLDDLGLGSRYDLAFAARDFVDLGKGRPSDRTRKKRSDDEYRRRREKRRSVFPGKHFQRPNVLNALNKSVLSGARSL